MHGREREASRLASETMALVESIAEPTLTVGLSFPRSTKTQTGEFDALRWSQTVIDLADGDPPKGTSSSDLHWRLRWRRAGPPAEALGRAGWRDDLRHGLAMARGTDPMSYSPRASPTSTAREYPVAC